MNTHKMPRRAVAQRADKALATAYPEHSRTAWARAFDAGLVRVGEKVLDRNDTVHGGDFVEYDFPPVVATELRAVELPLEVLYEDEHLIVLNKAAGIVVHPGAGTGEDTLVHALLAHCAGELSGIGGVERPGIVHRLDRETSGVIVVAKHDAAHRGLAEQFAERNLHKEYLALVTGVPRLLSGVIDRPISRHATHRHRMTAGEGGKPARTDWQVEEAFPGHQVTLLRCRIHTGRTHQIRVHLKFLGHIILGDTTYGYRPLEMVLPLKPERVMLHAAYLKFTHPVTEQVLKITAPWPPDFTALVTSLRRPE